MADISNNPIANAAVATSESARRDDETQQAARQRTGAAATVVQAAATGVAPERAGQSANGLNATQRVSDVSVSPEARQRLAAENGGQIEPPAATGGGNTLQQRINELLGDPSAASAPVSIGPTDVSGGRGVSGGQLPQSTSAAERGREPVQVADRAQPSSVEPADTVRAQPVSDGQQSSDQTNNDLTGNPGRLQRA